MLAKRYLAILAIIALLLVSLPYLMGFQFDSPQFQFGGFLINPIDGHSYLAKMQQGAEGNWKFKLPFTAEPGEGAYLFLFYLGLGHLSRLLGLPPIWVFHGARWIASIGLILIIYRMLRALFRDEKAIKAGLLLALFGSGLGWLAALAGGFTSDFWVAEAYPFLSMYTNPHFTLGLGFMIYCLLPQQRNRLFPNLVSGLLLGIIQPFAVVIISIVKIMGGSWTIYQQKLKAKQIIRSEWFWSIVGFCLTGGAVVSYQYWAILTDPVLSQWNQQNITAKPGLLDLLLSLSPALILGGIGARRAWKDETGKLLLYWAVVGLALVFIPWSLQRRFLAGVYFPLVILCVYGLRVLADGTSLPYRQWLVAVAFLAIPTNIIVLASGLQAISERNPSIYLAQDLAAGLKWITDNTDQNDLILADPEEGLYVPSSTGRRVVYGHPFETVQAEKEMAFVEGIFYEEQTDDYYRSALDTREIDYVLINGIQAQNFDRWLQENWHPAYQSGEMTIYTRWKNE